jgi:predicted nucleotidyltransferase component of viral defense system
MLYKESTEKVLMDLLLDLMQWDELKDFRLVGGTGLSLQLGHRKSIDIDMFTDNEISIENLAKKIHKKYPYADIRKLSFGLTLYIPNQSKKDLKVDLMETEKFIKPAIFIENIRFASLEDIAAMKLEAITSRHTKKDYYDIAELLNFFNFENLLQFYKQKYPYNDVKQVLENLTNFTEECEMDFEPDSLISMDWMSVKFKIIDAFDDFMKNKISLE